MDPIKRDTHDIYPFISATGRLAGAAKDKVVIVTGGGKGIGKAVALQFALAGAKQVFIIGREQAALDVTASEIHEQVHGSTITGVAADTTDNDTATKFFESLPKDLIPDILINNAGVNSNATLIADSDPLLWWRDYEVNLKGTYLMTRAFLQCLNGAPGVIVNVTTSVAGMSVPNMSAYGGSKAAVNRFTETVQVEYGPQGVRCLCLHPGGIESTGMGQDCPPQFKGTLLDTVELAAGTILYLTTPEASYLDGRMVLADWNMERVEQLKDEIAKGDLLVPRINFGSTLKFWEIVGLPEGMALSN